MLRTPHQNMVAGVALVPTTISGTINGARIVAPALKGRYLSFLLTLPAMASVSAFSARVEGSNDGGSTWAPVKQNDGVTDLAFTGSKFIAAGSNVSSVTLGSIDVSRAAYKDYRLGNITATGATPVVAASYVITDLWDHPGVQDDELLNNFLPTGS